MSTILYVSKETLEQLKDELHRMRTGDRPAAARAIAEAREKGDLKENAEYARPAFRLDPYAGRFRFG